MMREMYNAVDEIGAVTQREGIDCGYAKGGALWLASDALQLGRLRRRMAMLVRHGLGDAYEFLDPTRTIARVNATGMHGSIYTPHAAAVHPARLARGIARAVGRYAGTVHEMTPALEIDEARLSRRTERSPRTWWSGRPRATPRASRGSSGPSRLWATS